MRPVSDAFLSIIRGSHQIDTRATVLTTYQDGTAPSGTVIPILAGNVILDSTASVRATLDMTTFEAWPRPDGLLAPYGNEVFIERAVRYGSGTREWVSQGYFRINATEQSNKPGNPIRITGTDRTQGIADARLTNPVQFMVGQTVQDAFDALVLEVYPDAQFDMDFDASLVLFTRTNIVEEDRLGFLQSLVTSLGKIMYWDYRGFLVVKDLPPDDVPVFTVNSGAGGVMMALNRALNREGVYNAVVVRGEATDEIAPVLAIARDMNPASPTYWAGRFGKVPRFYSSPFVETVQQAQSAAAALLRQVLGLPYSVDLTLIPNPALEPLDAVRVVHSEGSEIHVIEQITVPLLATDPMTATTRERTDSLIETE